MSRRHRVAVPNIASDVTFSVYVGRSPPRPRRCCCFLWSIGVAANSTSNILCTATAVDRRCVNGLASDVIFCHELFGLHATTNAPISPPKTCLTFCYVLFCLFMFCTRDSLCRPRLSDSDSARHRTFCWGNLHNVNI